MQLKKKHPGYARRFDENNFGSAQCFTLLSLPRNDSWSHWFRLLACGAANHSSQNPPAGDISPLCACARQWASARLFFILVFFPEARRSVKMALGPGPLDELFSQTGVNKAVVCHPARSVESPLSCLYQNNHWGRREAESSYTVIVPGGSSS